MADPAGNRPAPSPDAVESIRFFETLPTDPAPQGRTEVSPPRLEPAEIVPIRDPGPSAPSVGRAVPASEPVDARPATTGAGEQLARLEDKASRIEEKLARSEAQTQRVVDRFEMAAGRMAEVALQSDLNAVRAELGFVARRVRALPGFAALMTTAVVTALLTAAIFVAILRYVPGLLAR